MVHRSLLDTVSLLSTIAALILCEFVPLRVGTCIYIKFIIILKRHNSVVFFDVKEKKVCPFQHYISFRCLSAERHIRTYNKV